MSKNSKISGIPLSEKYSKSRALRVSARSTKNNIEHLQLIKNAINTTHKATMELKPTEGEEDTNFLKKIENHATDIRKKLNQEHKDIVLTPKILKALGEIDRHQLEEQAHYAKLFKSGTITQRHLMNADLYLLETNPKEFIEKHNLDKLGLTVKEIENLLSKYKFRATSEKLQTMTNIAKRAQTNINQNSTKMINYLDKKIKILQSSNQPTIYPNNKLAARLQNMRLEDINNSSSTV